MTRILADVRKFLVALAAVLGVVVTQLAADGTVAHWVNVAITAIGAALVYLVPNGTTGLPAVPPADPPKQETASVPVPVEASAPDTTQAK